MTYRCSHCNRTEEELAKVGARLTETTCCTSCNEFLSLRTALLEGWIPVRHERSAREEIAEHKSECPTCQGKKSA